MGACRALGRAHGDTARRWGAPRRDSRWGFRPRSPRGDCPGTDSRFDARRAGPLDSRRVASQPSPARDAHVEDPARAGSSRLRTPLGRRARRPRPAPRPGPARAARDPPPSSASPHGSTRRVASAAVERIERCLRARGDQGIDQGVGHRHRRGARVGGVPAAVGACGIDLALAGRSDASGRLEPRHVRHVARRLQAAGPARREALQEPVRAALPTVDPAVAQRHVERLGTARRRRRIAPLGDLQPHAGAVGVREPPCLPCRRVGEGEDRQPVGRRGAGHGPSPSPSNRSRR